MKKIIGRSLLFLVLCIVSSHDLASKVTFGSRESALKVASGARLNNNSSNFSINGSLIQDPGANVTGNALSFNHGVLEDRKIEVVMTALYDPQGLGAIRLEGNSFVRAEPGTLVSTVTVAHQNNRLEGQPLFSSPITLADGGTQLTIALQDMLNQSIILNGGKLILNDHLHLSDEVRLSGSGTIDLNGKQLSFGSSYSAPWSNSLLFKNALDISLNGNIDLTGTWTFSGVCSLHGNGSIINMINGGQIILDPNTVLYLDDVFVRGLGNSNGQFVFGNRNAQIRSSNSTFKLASDYLVDIGGIYVEGPTTFALDGNNWTFDLTGSLTVDGVTLWLDPLDTPCLVGGGQIFAPLPLYNSDFTINNANVSFDIASGTLSLINRGSIKEVVDRACITPGEMTCDLLLDGSVTTSMNLTQCCGCVGPFQRIKIDENVCINGNGTTIEFTNPDTPQLIVSAGKILTLKNISLLRIGANTIDMRPGSRINIDEGVLFEFSQDVTFSQGLLSLTPSCTPNAGDGYIFTMRGIGCRKRINMFPLLPPQTLLQLRVNTLLLDNIELGGFSSMTLIENPSFLSGAIALASNAAVNIDVDTNMNFFVEGSNNDLVLQDDGITLSGNIAFGDLPDNTLTIKSALTTPINPNAPYRGGAAAENPLVFFSGNPGVFVFSDTGFANLIFNDFSFSVNNENVNAFVVDNSSYLSFNNLEILNNAIKQSSVTFRSNGLLLSGLQINQTFIRTPQAFAPNSHIVPTAIYLQRQKEKSRFWFEQIAAQKHEKMKLEREKERIQKEKERRQKKKEKLKQRPGLEYLQDRAFHDGNNDALDILEQALDLNHASEYVLTRALNLPPDTVNPRFDQSYANNAIYTPAPTVPLKQALRFNLGAAVKNFTVDPAIDFNILLQNGSQMTQSDTQSIAVLDSTHIVNVSGLGNVINVRRTLQIDEGGLLFPSVNDAKKDANSNAKLDIQANTELIFQFINDGPHIPTVILNQDNLVLEQGTILRFQGNGQVILNNGKKITFNGKRNNNTGVVTGPSLVITDDVQFMLAPPVGKVRPVAFMSGIGFIQLSTRGRLEVNNAGSLVIGSTNPPANKPNDMQIQVFGSAQILIGSGKVGLANLAKLSIWNTNLSFDIENNGQLSILRGGQVEINAEVNGQSIGLKQGDITDFSVSSNGGIFIDALATLVLANNIGDTTFQWNGIQGIFTGCGFVEYVAGQGSPLNFTGKLSATDSDLYTQTTLTSEELAELLVQQNSELHVSTVFINEDNVVILRTKNGVLVTLQPGDTVLSDDPSGNVLVQDASGNLFSYNANGEPI